MKIAIIIFLWIAGFLFLFTLAVVIYDLAVSSKDRKKKLAEERHRRAMEEKQRKKREAENAALRKAHEAEVRAMQDAARAQEAAARAMNSILPQDDAFDMQGNTVSLGAGTSLQTIRIHGGPHS